MKIDKEIFERNLLLTQAYCDRALARNEKSPSKALRTYNPDCKGEPLFSFKDGPWTFVNWGEDPLLQTSVLYDTLFEDQLKHKEQAMLEFDGRRNFEGRILFAEIDETVIDGASEAESKGFIDGNDSPPIDTWFYLTRDRGLRIIFAWIPLRFVALANSAIEVNCVDCLQWYTDENMQRREENIQAIQHLIQKGSSPSVIKKARSGLTRLKKRFT